MTSYVAQMCNMGFPEYATPICKDGLPNAQFLQKMKGCSKRALLKEIDNFIDSEKLKNLLSVNFLASPKNIPLESLMALNSFWSNRYVKELSSYSEMMYAVHEFDIINKVLNDEKVNISKNDIEQMLLKMNTLYPSARHFLESQTKKFTTLTVDEIEAIRATTSKSDEKIEEKVIRYSYDPYYEIIRNKFNDEYTDYFSKILPNSKNDLVDDAEWYIRLINPINSSYALKDLAIFSMIASLDNPDFPNILNAGIILDKSYGNNGYIPKTIGIGVDSGLSYPTRIHINSDVLREFVISINGSSFIPVYEGADDFSNPNSGKPLVSPLILPVGEKQKNIMKKSLKNLKKYEHPKFVSHLCFFDTKHTPEHLKSDVVNSRGKHSKVFIPKYFDLDTGFLYNKVNDSFERIEDKSQELGGIDFE